MTSANRRSGAQVGRQRIPVRIVATLVALLPTVGCGTTREFTRIVESWEAMRPAYEQWFAERTGEEAQTAVIDFETIHPATIIGTTPEEMADRTERRFLGLTFSRTRSWGLERVPPRTGLQGINSLEVTLDRRLLTTQVKADAYISDESDVDPEWGPFLIGLFEEVGVELTLHQ